MDAERLRQNIARMVREILDKEMKAVIDAALPQYADFKKGVLVMLSRPVVGMERMLSHIKAEYPEARLHIAGPKGCADPAKLPKDARVYAIDDVTDSRILCDSFDRQAHVFWLSPPLSEMKKLMEGDDDGFARYAMLSAQALDTPSSLLFPAEYAGAGAMKAHRDAQAALKGAGFACETIGTEQREVEDTQAHELVTEQDVKAWRTAGVRSIYLKKGCVITPLARDTAKEVGLRLNWKP